MLTPTSYDVCFTASILISFCCLNLCDGKGTTNIWNTQTFVQKSFFLPVFLVHQYVKDQVIYHLVMYHLFIYWFMYHLVMVFASVLSREAGLYLSVLCYCYIFYAALMRRAGFGCDAALMHRAGETGLLRGRNKKQDGGKRTIRVRLHFGCSPPEEENADCQRAMINISE